jgi:hypothetical protein
MKKFISNNIFRKIQKRNIILNKFPEIDAEPITYESFLKRMNFLLEKNKDLKKSQKIIGKYYFKLFL